MTDRPRTPVEGHAAFERAKAIVAAERAARPPLDPIAALREKNLDDYAEWLFG